ncbi:MAG: efflux RND transporter permease subunit, partial [Saprospiraceae bacterium]
MKIAEFSVKNSQFTFIIFLAVMALGIGSLLNMPRAEDPKFIAPGFTIIMVYPGAGPSEIENKITDKVEARLWALGDIDRMRSASANGIGVVTMEFKHGQDPDKKYEEVLREINAARPELPELYRLEIQRFSASDVAMLQIGLVSENASWAQLRAEAERLEERLERIPGMKGADVWGFPKREVRISLNLPRMAAEGVPASRIFGALQSENVSIPGGSVNVGERQFSVETSGDYESIEEVRNTIINVNGGKILYLKDLAEVEFAYEEPRHLTRTNGVRSVFVTARMKDEQNIFNVGEDAYRALDEFKAALPPNVDMVKIFDQNDSVVKRLSRFAKDFGIAIALVLLTLLPLGWRAATVVMISIPLSISIGLFAMDKLGYSLNQLSIVGLIIALGILVDDAIVVVENIERWLRDGYKRRDAAILATKQIGLAVLGCTATLILAFLPLVYLPEAAGDFIRSLPMAVVTTVIASLFVSLTIVPFLGSRMLAEHHDPRGNIFLRGLKWLISKSYAKLLHVGLRNPRWTMFFSALIFFGVLSLAGRAGFSVFPASERPMFLIDIEMAAGTNLEKTNAIAQMVDSVLLTYSVDGGRLTADGQTFALNQSSSTVHRP